MPINALPSRHVTLNKPRQSQVSFTQSQLSQEEGCARRLPHCQISGSPRLPMSGRKSSPESSSALDISRNLRGVICSNIYNSCVLRQVCVVLNILVGQRPYLLQLVVPGNVPKQIVNVRDLPICERLGKVRLHSSGCFKPYDVGDSLFFVTPL